MVISQLDKKAIQEAIKRGVTPEELQLKYGCSNEEMEEWIRHLYKRGSGEEANRILKKLKSNYKLPRGSGKKAASTSAFPMVEAALNNLPNGPLDEELFGNSLLDEAPSSDIPASVVRTLSFLKEEETRLSNEVIDLETAHVSERSARHTYRETLRSIDAELDKYVGVIEGLKKTIEETTIAANAAGERMNKISTERREKMEELTSIREEIAEMSKVSLYVYADGRIEAPDNPDFVLDDEGHLELKAELLEREECLNLRIRDITTLARLLKISEKAEKFSLVCDNEELETAFWAVSENSSDSSDPSSLL